MNFRSTQPRKVRIALIGLAAAGLSIVALPQAVSAQYPPQPPPQQQSPPPPVQPAPTPKPPEEVASRGVAAAGAVTVTSSDALPATGGSPTQILWIASSALLAGVAISAASLRRRNAVNSGN